MKWIFLLVVVVFSIASALRLPVGAAETLPGPVTAEVVSVHDGDTFKIRARIWLGHTIETSVRIAGLDTPERRARCPAEAVAAALAKDALVALLASGGAVLYDVRYGKYAGRVLARVETLDGRDAGQAIIEAGLGRPYRGGKRRGWCGEDMARRHFQPGPL